MTQVPVHHLDGRVFSVECDPTEVADGAIKVGAEQWQVTIADAYVSLQPVAGEGFPITDTLKGYLIIK